MSEIDKNQQVITGQQEGQPEQQQQKGEWEGDTYTVEFVTDKRLNVYTGQVEYRIRWLGYEEKDDTWEPAENMSHLTAIKEFEDNLKKKQQQKEGQKKRASQGAKPRKSSNGAAVTKRKTESATSGVTTRKANPSPATADASNQQEKTRDESEKVPSATMIREEDFGGDSIEDVSVQVEGLNELRLEEPTPGKHYKIQAGVAAKKIFSVAARDDGPVSLVQYEDSTFEIIPTQVLADCCPKLLISFYEARLVYKA